MQSSGFLTFTARLAAAALFCGAPQAASAAGPPLPDCTCRNFGADAPLGARLCIETPQGQRVAVCVRAQNVTSWQPGDERCGELSQLAAPER